MNIKIAEQLLKIAKQLISDLNEQQKKLTDEYTEKRNKNLSFGKMFSNERTYFPVTKTMKKIAPPEQINNLFENISELHKYEISDWQKGLACQKNNAKKQIKLIKLFNKIQAQNNVNISDDIKNMVINRGVNKKVQHQKILMCITHNAYDIAGMSTDRNWTSCMNLNNGYYKDTPLKQVQYGGMCAYLIDQNDKQISHPYARIAIKRLIGQNDTFIFIQEPIVYGDKYISDLVSFPQILKQKLDKSNKETMQQNQIFVRKDESYSDGNINYFFDKNMPLQKIYQYIDNCDEQSIIKIINSNTKKQILQYILNKFSKSWNILIFMLNLDNLPKSFIQKIVNKLIQISDYLLMEDVIDNNVPYNTISFIPDTIIQNYMDEHYMDNCSGNSMLKFFLSHNKYIKPSLLQYIYDNFLNENTIQILLLNDNTNINIKRKLIKKIHDNDKLILKLLIFHKFPNDCIDELISRIQYTYSCVEILHDELTPLYVIKSIFNYYKDKSSYVMQLLAYCKKTPPEILEEIYLQYKNEKRGNGTTIIHNILRNENTPKYIIDDYNKKEN